MSKDKTPLPPQTPEELKEKYGLAPDEIAWLQQQADHRK
jgi:hypothetical protein